MADESSRTREFKRTQRLRTRVEPVKYETRTVRRSISAPMRIDAVEDLFEAPPYWACMASVCCMLWFLIALGLAIGLGVTANNNNQNDEFASG